MPWCEYCFICLILRRCRGCQLTMSCAAWNRFFLITGNTLDKFRPTFDEGVSECTREMAKTHNQCLEKSEDKSYLETYNCEYIKSPKPQRFARAMVRLGYAHAVRICIVSTDVVSCFSSCQRCCAHRSNFIAQISFCRIMSTIQL